jgi:hypothetical protein
MYAWLDSEAQSEGVLDVAGGCAELFVLERVRLDLRIHHVVIRAEAAVLVAVELLDAQHARDSNPSFCSQRVGLGARLP